MTIGTVIEPAETGNAVDTAVEVARRAADSGVGSVWFGQRFDHDAISLATVVGHEVPQLQVGVSAVPIFARHPILVASQAQTAQAATHGRFHLGVALGAKSLIEAAFGITYERPVARLEQFLKALRELTTSGTADLRGDLITATPPLSTTVPGAPPSPLLVAAMGPRALEVTGRLADGTLPFLAGPRALSEHIAPTITAAARDAGRPPPRIVALVASVVTDDVETARARAYDDLAFYETIPSYRRALDLSGATRAGDLALIGNEETVDAGIQEYLAAGATEIVLSHTNMVGEESRSRTWRLAGELNRGRRRSAN